MTKVMDLFCGAGGFSLGAHAAGFRTAVAVDVDGVLTSSFADNFPNVSLLHSDIAELTGKQVLDKAGVNPGEIAGVLGGPPCQGFSAIGKRRDDDPRNGLVSHFFRIVRELDPTFFLMENVPGLIVERNKEILEAALSEMKRYEIVGPLVVNARDYGAPTFRCRVVVLGYKKDSMASITSTTIERVKCSRSYSVRDAISDLPNPNDRGWAKYRRRIPSEYATRARSQPGKHLGATLYKQRLADGIVSGVLPTQHTEAVRERFRDLAPGNADPVSRCPRLMWDAPAPTLRAGTGPERGSYQSIRPIHPDSDRVITVREAARLQGFPDWFKFHETKWHSFRMIGNSVSPPLSQRLLQAIARAMS